MKTIKCVVWDLDNTVWDGTLLEGDDVSVRPGVREAIEELDRRGIVNSVASRNDPAAALARLEEVGLATYLVHPQIGWGTKSQSIRTISERLNLATDTFAFVDDQAFERDEVRHEVADVLCVGADDVPHFLDLERMKPRFVTDDSRLRRAAYQAEARRMEDEERFDGSSTEFLATLGMRMTIAPAEEADLRRAEELTVRTNQLNATGRTYSYEELDELRRSPDHDLLIAGLDDRYGSYGKIGLCLVERTADGPLLRLLLMSCRVMSRGVGSVMLQHVIRAAQDQGQPLRAHFVTTDRNRAMFVTYKFAGFKTIGEEDGVLLLEHDGSPVPPVPGHLELSVMGPVSEERV